MPKFNNGRYIYKQKHPSAYTGIIIIWCIICCSKVVANILFGNPNWAQEIQKLDGTGPAFYDLKTAHPEKQIYSCTPQQLLQHTKSTGYINSCVIYSMPKEWPASNSLHLGNTQWLTQRQRSLRRFITPIYYSWPEKVPKSRISPR